MNKFDSGSFNMRYPVFLKKKKQDLIPSVAENRLIVPNFHKKMQAFFNAVVQLDSDIDNLVRFDVEEEKMKRFIQEYEATKTQIENIIKSAKKLKGLRDKYNHDKPGISFYDSLFNRPTELIEAEKC